MSKLEVSGNDWGVEDTPLTMVKQHSFLFAKFNGKGLEWIPVCGSWVYRASTKDNLIRIGYIAAQFSIHT